MDKLFSANFEDNEVYNVTLVETENLRDNPPESPIKGKVGAKPIAD
ncbi:MAG: hypothetical protein K2N18_06055 [Clostridia bacterium]|nr:hypothetical protein [Clostridia bacterium]